MLRLLLLLLLPVGAVYAQSSGAPSPYKYLDLPNGQRQIVPQSDTRAAQNGQQIWNQATANTATGQVQVGRSVSIPTPFGGSVAVAARGVLPPRAVAAAVGRFAVKVLPGISTAIALGQLLDEIGFTRTGSTPETFAFTKPPSGSFYNANWGQQYQFATRQAVCTAYARSLGQPALFAIGSSNSCYYDAEGTNSAGSVIGVLPPTGPSIPATREDLEDAIAARSSWPATSKISDVILEDPRPDLQVPTSIIASGPASTPGPVSTTNNTANNTSSTSTTNNNYSYAGDTMTTNVTTVIVTTNNTTGAVTTETTNATPPPPAPPPIVVCGVPGNPPCKIDETSTPLPVPSGTYSKDLDKLETDRAASIPTIAATSDKSFFEPLRSLFVVPPVASCEPFELPRNMGSIDPCPVADGMRQVMGYIWALTALFLSLRMVREVI